LGQGWLAGDELARDELARGASEADVTPFPGAEPKDHAAQGTDQHPENHPPIGRQAGLHRSAPKEWVEPEGPMESFGFEDWPGVGVVYAD
jgi:hypothetical protein